MTSVSSKKPKPQKSPWKNLKKKTKKVKFHQIYSEQTAERLQMQEYNDLESLETQRMILESIEREKQAKKRAHQIAKQEEEQKKHTSHDHDFALALQIQQQENKKYLEQQDLLKFYAHNSKVQPKLDEISPDLLDDFVMTDPSSSRCFQATTISGLKREEDPLAGLDLSKARTKHDPEISGRLNAHRLSIYEGTGNLSNGQFSIGSKAYNALRNKLDRKKVGKDLGKY